MSPLISEFIDILDSKNFPKNDSKYILKVEYDKNKIIKEFKKDLKNPRGIISISKEYYRNKTKKCKNKI